MSMNIYNAFIVNSDKQLSVKDCVDLANNSKAKMMKTLILEHFMLTYSFSLTENLMYTSPTKTGLVDTIQI